MWSITSAALDTACTSNAGKLGGPFIPKALQSNKVFALADGHPTPATTVSLLKHNLLEAARTVHIVPALAHQSLLSGGQFVDAEYISICDCDEVNIYDEKQPTSLFLKKQSSKDGAVQRPNFGE